MPGGVARKVITAIVPSGCLQMYAGRLRCVPMVLFVWIDLHQHVRVSHAARGTKQSEVFLIYLRLGRGGRGRAFIVRNLDDCDIRYI